MIQAALFAIIKIWKQPKCPPLGEEISMAYSSDGILLSNKMGQITDTSNNRDGTENVDAEGQKPDKKCTIYSIYIKVQKTQIYSSKKKF